MATKAITVQKGEAENGKTDTGKAVKVTKQKGKVHQSFKYTTAKVLGLEELEVKVPIRMWQELWNLSQHATGEYSVMMAVEEVKAGKVFRPYAWCIPHQIVSGASVDLAPNAGPALIKEMGEHFEDLYGVFHIHPGSGKTVSMSGQDVRSMWAWVQNAGRGVFIVSNKSGAGSAVYVKEANGIIFQVPMKLTIDWHLPQDWKDEWYKRMDDRCHKHSYKFQSKAIAVEKGAAAVRTGQRYSGYVPWYDDYWDDWEQYGSQYAASKLEKRDAEATKTQTQLAHNMPKGMTQEEFEALLSEIREEKY